MSTFEPFKFCYVHSVREADRSTVICTAATDPDHPIDNLRDNRISTYWKQNAAGAWSIRWDRGANFADLPDLTRLIIPAGHTLSGILRVKQDDDPAYGSTTELLAISVVTAGSQVDLPFTVNGDERYMELVALTGLYEIPQLIVTTTFEPTTGFDPGNLVDELVSNDRTFPQPSGTAPSLVLGPQQRRFEVEYLRLESAELGAMEKFVSTVGTSEPFWVEPPIFGASAILDQDLSDVSAGNISVTDGGDMLAGTNDYTIGDERITGSFVNATTFFIASRGDAGTTARAHEVGARIVYHPNDGAEHHRARWMKFESMPDSRIESVSLSRGKRKSFRLALIDHVD